jgi:hypothetical protein
MVGLRRVGCKGEWEMSLACGAQPKPHAALPEFAEMGVGSGLTVVLSELGRSRRK